MDHDVEYKVDIVKAAICVVSIIVLFVRMEMKIRYCEKDLGEIKNSHDEKSAVIGDKFEEVHKTLLNISNQLGRVEGKIDAKH